VSTFTIETLMQDKKALQAGTSHFLGQNFSRAQNIKFQDENGQEVFGWTTSWGMTTRLIGALTMVHSDDDGLVLPPKLAPAHVVILPIFRSDEDKAEVMPYCAKLEHDLASQTYAGEPIRVRIDSRDIRGGDKKWQWVKRGVPVRVEVGPRDIAGGKVSFGRRDQAGRLESPRAEFVANISKTLDEIQHGLLARAMAFREEASVRIDDLKEFEAFFTPKTKEETEIHGGYAYCHFAESSEMDEVLKRLKVTVRCLPLGGEEESGKCIFTGRSSARRAVFAKAY
jgi:prolyl-tRNA synthetase